MSDCGYRSGLHVVSIREDSSFIEHPLQAGFVVLAKAQQIIVAELINHDRHDQARSLRSVVSPCEKGRERKGAEEDSFCTGQGINLLQDAELIHVTKLKRNCIDEAKLTLYPSEDAI